MVEVDVKIRFQGNLKEELKVLDEACKGDRPDPFGHLKYWKCMIALKPYILENEIRRSDVKEIAKKIGFSEDQVVRSLDRFVDKGVLIKNGRKFYSVWKLNYECFPIINFVCVKKNLAHIVRHYLATDPAQNITSQHIMQE